MITKKICILIVFIFSLSLTNSVSNRKKILFYGYFGHGNTGDEAILESEINILRQLDPTLQLSVITSNKERAKELDLKPYDYFNIFDIYNAIDEVDLVISGGGGLFQDISGEFTPFYYGLIIYIAGISNKKVFLFGQGFGPILKEKSKSYLRKFLPYSTEATFRDEDSAREFIAYAPNVPTFHTSDPAFSYNVGRHDRGIEILKKMKVKDLNKKIIYLTVRDIPILEEVVPNAINKWYDSLTDKNIQIIIIPFQYNQDFEISNRISKLIKVENYVSPQLLPSEIMDLFAIVNCQLIISTRLHGIILGATSNKCCMSISYAPKVERISKLIRAPYIKVDGISEDSFISLLANTWENRNDIKKTEYQIALEQKRLAIETGKMALKLIDY